MKCSTAGARGNGTSIKAIKAGGEEVIKALR